MGLRSVRGHRRAVAAAASWLILTSALALASAPAAAQLERSTGLQPPDLLELTGHVGKPTAQETGGWNLVLGDRFRRRTWEFHLFHMRILNSGRLPMSVLSAVEPYDPNFFLFDQEPGQMEALAAATPADRVVLTGYRRLGSRNILLTGVQVLPSGTPSPAAGSP